MTGAGLINENFDWYYWAPAKANSGFSSRTEYAAYNPADFFDELKLASAQPYHELSTKSYDDLTYAESMVLFDNTGASPPAYDTLPGYERLVRAVARFSNPTLAESG